MSFLNEQLLYENQDLRDEIERLREEQKAMLVTMRDRAVEIERLRLERDEHRQSAVNAIHGYKQSQARIAKLENVLKAAEEYEAMFARTRTKPYGISNELQALFDALAEADNGQP